MNDKVDKFAEELLKLFPKSEIKSVLYSEDFSKYQKDPVGFAKRYFNVELPDDLKRLCESVRDNRVTIAQSCTGFGKTFVGGFLSIWFYLCFKDSIVTTAAAPPERNLKDKLWGEIRSNIRANPDLFLKHKITSLRIEDVSGSNVKEHFITGITIPTSGSDEDKEARISGSHAPAQLFILDEGDAIPDAIYRAIDGCMSGKFERLVIFFNPKKRSGAAYRKIQSGDANVIILSAFNHPNVITGEELIPGAVTRDVTVRRINTMTKKLAPGEEPDPKTCFEVPDFLVGAVAKGDGDFYYPPLDAGWRRIENQSFYYQVLGEYPSQAENQLISSEWINQARTRWDLYVAQFGEKPPEGIRPTNGMDVADEGGDNNSVVSRYGGFIARPIKWKGVDPQRSAERAAQIHKDVDAVITNVESDGLGASVAPTMCREYYFRCFDCKKSYNEKELNESKCPNCGKELKRTHIDARKVKVASSPTKQCELGEFDSLRDELWWSLREWLRTDNTAMLPPDDELIEELEVPTYEAYTKVKVMDKKKMRKALGRSPDSADSLIQTFYTPSLPRVRMIG